MKVEDMSSYIEGFKNRVTQDETALRKRLETGRSEARQLARLLADEYGVDRVYLVGSMTHGRIHSQSDIDLAVEGLAPELYWKASAHLERHSKIAVDLIDLDGADTVRANRLRKGGVVLVE